ncbi:MAG: hypothetical protein ABIV48_11450, partial [Pyrinomonadaceae bacterium]
MKRCPECGRNYNDDSMSFCLDDGSELLFGPASVDEPATAILSELGAVATGSLASESPTRAQVHSTDHTEILPTPTGAAPLQKTGGGTSKPIMIFGVVFLLLLGVVGFAVYKYNVVMRVVMRSQSPVALGDGRGSISRR